VELLAVSSYLPAFGSNMLKFRWKIAYTSLDNFFKV
jgi:hypothetical protein